MRRRTYWKIAACVAVSFAYTSGYEVPVNAGGTPRSTARSTAQRTDPVVAFINQQIRDGWENNDVQPSDVADDAEWLRRVTLDLIGRIPTIDEIETFLQDRNENKRAATVERLLEDPAYVRHWTTVWANLLIGRQTPPRTSRDGLEKFLREAFARNRPWNEVVADLLTAEGRFDENGAVNFLLAHLNGDPSRDDYTVEATARATRLFLGTQVQCTQCHDHPFNEWKQAQFWEFDSFLKQIRRVDHRRTDPATGTETDDYSELVHTDYSGPVYFEQRSGVMEVAYPHYNAQEVDPGPQTNRREELATLMSGDENRQLARAMVNRTWGHFFGYGFTRPVDDMGPHNPPSHPELLERLTEEFAASEYDVKQLIRWIANSEAYQLTSRFNRNNKKDDPAAGETPLFSHLSIKPLTAEQFYDSLVTATQVDQMNAGGFEAAEQQRRQWLRDLVLLAAGNEDDEPTQFDGSISQSLMLMNGPLVESAVRCEPGGALHAVLSDEKLKSDIQRIRRIYLMTLNRLPSKRESNAAEKLIVRSPDKQTAYQDLLWALLNSNEFAMNH